MYHSCIWGLSNDEEQLKNMMRSDDMKTYLKGVFEGRLPSKRHIKYKAGGKI